MMGKLGEVVKGDTFVLVLICIILIAYFVYKEWPEFKKRVSSDAVKDQAEENKDKTIEERLASIEKAITEINARLSRDYDRLNGVEEQQKTAREFIDESLEEREIIMEALLGALGGLQELGANGPTREAVKKINGYLNRKAHNYDTKSV